MPALFSARIRASARYLSCLCARVLAGLPAVVALAAVALAPAPAAAQKARLNRLNDVAFGTLAVNATSDIQRSETLCAFTGSSTMGYFVSARGSGAGGAFTLSSGTATLPYVVRWAGLPDATDGVALSPNQPRAMVTSAPANALCSLGLGGNATLIIGLPAAEIAAARAGAYSGTITITIAPN